MKGKSCSSLFVCISKELRKKSYYADLFNHLFGFNLFWHWFSISFQYLTILCLVKDYWRGLNTRNTYMVHIVNYKSGFKRVQQS